MTLAEALETTGMHRVASLTDDRLALVTTCPFRALPHPITEVGVTVGCPVPLPGEVPLAHHGVLCLDPRPEYRRHVLEGLRQPLEESTL
jgi:magnesium chelatase family protein